MQQLAASHMAQRRRAFEAALATFEAFDEVGAVDVLAGPREEIGPALYVGQSSRLLKRGSTPDVQRYVSDIYDLIESISSTFL